MNIHTEQKQKKHKKMRTKHKTSLTRTAQYLNEVISLLIISIMLGCMLGSLIYLHNPKVQKENLYNIDEISYKTTLPGCNEKTSQLIAREIETLTIDTDFKNTKIVKQNAE